MGACLPVGQPLFCVLVAAGALAAAGCGGESAAPPAETTNQTKATIAARPTLLQPRDAQELIATGDVEVLDVRTPEEYAEGHIEGATLIDFYEPDFADRIAELDHGATYVVYCRSGNRSEQAVALMKEQGFTAVNDLDGGVTAWSAAGLPLTR
jgi:rhodanese-related sulfurtransferase